MQIKTMMRYKLTSVRMAIIKNLQINAGEGVKKWEPSYTVGGNVNWCTYYGKQGFPGGSDSKVSACNAGDPGLIPGLGRSPGEGNGNLLQYSCLENSMDRGAL